eukprot:3781014-Rhodomonas_salina.2
MSGPSLRSVLAVTPSQKMLIPPSTIGIDAVSVVLICHGASPLLGLVGPGEPPASARATVSTALTTKDTKMLFERSDAAMPSKTSKPRGILKETNWSGTDPGLTHMLACGPQSCVTMSLNVSFSPSNPASPKSSASAASSYSEQRCSMPSAASTSSRNVPMPARTESSGISPTGRFGAYCSPIVNVTCLPPRVS